MSFNAARNTFITYNNPAEFQNSQNRRAVSSHASKSYRPTTRRIVLDRTHYRPFSRHPGGGESISSAVLKTEERQGPTTKRWPPPARSIEPSFPRDIQPLDERLLGSPQADPFTTYPIAYQPYIPFLVDYFIRFLTPRFSPALAVETSRYLIWFNRAMNHSEMFHALIALSQVYHNIDIKGFGNTHWTALYHRGEALKQLRMKVETAQCADDDAAILTALWLMDVDAAHGDLNAYAMHKRAEEGMVLTRGGIRKLNPELQDELLKSEFFLPLLLHGKFESELTDDDVLVRFKENVPVRRSPARGFQRLFSVLASKGLITTQTVDILQRIYQQISQGQRNIPEVVNSGTEHPVVNTANEMSRVLRITDETRPTTSDHRLLLALLVYIFNYHNQPRETLLRSGSATIKTCAGRPPYLNILRDVTLELSTPSNPWDPSSVTEREVTLWTVVAIGSASSSSPWRLEIPFMGHLIEWMEKEDDDDDDDNHNYNNEHSNHNYKMEESAAGMGIDTGTVLLKTECDVLGTVQPEGWPLRERNSNMDKLTACLRGYYLYGADKHTLRTLETWEGPDPPR
ncbi:hypothetical protein A1O1_06429 [Capronia coronata CBS 617.96]|uniref:Uncharacterized protein n=1 Tax=Capronia coronata CBS 617.96 TaxID=1182541 RepID=W9Y8V1_9EURO|nr:uncharacterized protein A1O1_06429 [Capronia coronata CBS 617.96]EXJ86060.1 hypothetical protein A1O1_06429 [Capronia coronata CBS 617.96]